MQARARFYSKNVYFTKPEFGYMEKKYYLCNGFGRNFSLRPFLAFFLPMTCLEYPPNHPVITPLSPPFECLKPLFFSCGGIGSPVHRREVDGWRNERAIELP